MRIVNVFSPYFSESLKYVLVWLLHDYIIVPMRKTSFYKATCCHLVDTLCTAVPLRIFKLGRILNIRKTGCNLKNPTVSQGNQLRPTITDWRIQKCNASQWQASPSYKLSSPEPLLSNCVSFSSCPPSKSPSWISTNTISDVKDFPVDCTWSGFSLPTALSLFCFLRKTRSFFFFFLANYLLHLLHYSKWENRESSWPIQTTSYHPWFTSGSIAVLLSVC